MNYSELGASFRQFMDGQVDESSNPFSTRVVEGRTSWLDEGSILKLDNRRFASDENLCEFGVVVKVGFAVELEFTSSKWGQFASLTNSFRDEGFNDERIDDFNSGIGGDSIIRIRLAPGDSLSLDYAIQPTPQMTVNLRREVVMDAGSWEAVENMSKSANVEVRMMVVDHYADPASNQSTDEGTEEGEGRDDVTPLEPDNNPDNDPSLVPDDEPGEFEFGGGWVVIAALVAIGLFMVVSE